MNLSGAEAKKKFYTAKVDAAGKKAAKKALASLGMGMDGDGFLGDVWDKIKAVSTVVYKAGKAIVSFTINAIKSLSNWLEKNGLKKSDQVEFLGMMAGKAEYAKSAQVINLAASEMRRQGMGKRGKGYFGDINELRKCKNKVDQFKKDHPRTAKLAGLGKVGGSCGDCQCGGAVSLKQNPLTYWQPAVQGHVNPTSRAIPNW